MAESASTREMYEGKLDHEETSRMPRSLQEDYNAAQADEPAKIGDEDSIEYDQDAMAEAIQAYENFDGETGYTESGPTKNEEALDAFGELFGEN